MARNGGAATCKLQVTIDPVTDRIIDEMVSLGFQGTTRGDVACTILRMWLWDNQEKLRQNGVFVANPAKVGVARKKPKANGE